MVLYTLAVVRLLAAINLWKVSLLKDTIVWLCVNAMAMMIRFITSDDAENIYQKVLTDSFKIVIVLEFLVNTYTFSLLAEIFLVLTFILITLVDVIVNSDEKYFVVAKITKWVQMVISFVILAIVFNRAISNFQTLLSLDTFRSIALAPLLSLLFTPFLYVMVLISKYELVFLRLNFGLEKERGLKRYARRRILIYAGLSLRKLQHLLRNHAADLMHIQTKADVDRLVQRRVNP